MMEDALEVLLTGQPAGEVRQAGAAEGRLRLSFHYHPTWRTSRDAFPLSASLPLVERDHRSDAVEHYLRGLLPDNGEVLKRWSREFQVSPGNTLGMLAAIGADCPGAVQFRRPGDPLPYQGGLVPLGEREIETRILELERDGSAWHDPSHPGRFSLAGAQAKTALFHDGTTWARPEGTVPSTHILKPEIPGHPGHVENEHFCMRLARAVGLDAAHTRVETFGAARALSVQRFDRAIDPGGDDGLPVVRRIHHEDTCQALGLGPDRRYESEGGPGIAEIVQLLRDHSDEPGTDVSAFLGAVAFNWLIAGTDAHAKNYSLLHTAGGRCRLAPLYDLSSYLPYADPPPKDLKLAMGIGKHYRLAEINLHRWRSEAESLQVPWRSWLDELRALTEAVLARVEPVRAELVEEGVRHPILTTLAERVHARAKDALRLLDAGE